MCWVVKSKHLDSFIVFILCFFYAILAFIGECKVYGDLSFDSQEFLAWNYHAIVGNFPFRDFYYPYGILFYFKNNILSISLLYILLFPTFVVSIFLFLKRIWTNKLIAYVAFFIYVFYIITLVGIQSFNRYGILLILVLLYAILLTKKKLINFKLYFLLGLTNGIVVTFFNEQGVYVFFAFLIFLIIHIFNFNYRFSLKLSSHKVFLSALSTFLIGAFLGIVPFFIFLKVNNAFYPFLENFTSLGDLVKYGKTPFFPSIRSAESMFNIFIVICSIGFLSYKVFFSRIQRGLGVYAMIILLVIIFLLMQKNFIRNIDSQIVIFTLVMLSLLVQHFYKRVQNQAYRKLLTLVIVLLPTLVFIFTLPTRKPQILFFDWELVSRSCIERNSESFNMIYQDYLKVMNVLLSYADFNGKVYSYPGDPIFYILFKQETPYYFSIYEGSPVYAQERRVQFIKNNNIKYIILNTENYAIQDNVPNYIRSNMEYKFIITNYYPLEKVGRFLILRKEINKDFIQSPLLRKELPMYYYYMLHVKLENIPRSEGKNKLKILNSLKNIFAFDTIHDFENQISQKPLSIVNKVMLVQFNNPHGKARLEFKTQDGKRTTVEFLSCGKDEFCVINMDNIPAFYINRGIISVESNIEIAKIVIKENSANSMIW